MDWVVPALQLPGNSLLHLENLEAVETLKFVKSLVCLVYMAYLCDQIAICDLVCLIC